MREPFSEQYILLAQKYFPEGCNICGSNNSVILTDSTIIYGSSYGLVYFCTNCKAYVGVHKSPDNNHGEINAPLGILADKEMIQLRKEAHKLFDPLWESTRLSRRGAYMVLQRVLMVPERRAHIAMLQKSELKKLIDYLNNLKINNDE